MSDLVEILTGESEEQPIVRKLATVGTVYSDGVSLIFDGESAASEKHYKANTAIIFAAGDRVKIAEVSGTYVVEYIVGAPGADYPASPLPTGGTTGQVLAKSGNGDYEVEWKSVGAVPAGGTTGQVLAKSGDGDYAIQWTTVGTVPAYGLAGQVLAKSSSTSYATSWVDISVDRVEYSSTIYARMSVSKELLPAASTSTDPYSLGNTTLPWYHLYTGGGNTRLCNASGKLGFFGATPAAKQTLSSSATAAQIVTALKAYGLYT